MEHVAGSMRTRRISFPERVRENRRRLVLLLGATVLLAAGAGGILGAAFGPGGEGAATYPNLIAGALALLALGQAVRAWRSGDEMILRLVRAEPLVEARFVNAAEEIAIAAGMETPRLFVAEDPSMNAFALETRGRRSIVLTRGLVDRLGRGALQAVLAHESAHLRTGDAMLVTFLCGMARVFPATAALAIRPLRALRAAARGGRRTDGLPRGYPRLSIAHGLSRRRPRPPGATAPLVTAALGAALAIAALPAILLLGCVAPFAGVALRLAVPRRTEFLADATAVALLGDPTPLAEALEAMRDDLAAPVSLGRSLAPLAIAPVRKGMQGGRGIGGRRVAARIEERIARLERMGARRGASVRRAAGLALVS